MTVSALESFARSSSAAVLDEIIEPDCNLTIWERPCPEGLETLFDQNTSDARFTTQLTELESHLETALTASGFADLPVRALLIEDVVQLSEKYGKIMGLDEVEIRLEIITTNSCRKWHSDYVKARLISTYVGTGTQWLDSQDASRVRDGQEPQRINTMAAGHVGLFKGKMSTEWPAIHRSPPIAGTGETRLLLVINPPEV